MRRVLVVSLVAAVALTGCAGFKLGAALYCPHGQNCALQVGPQETAAK